MANVIYPKFKEAAWSGSTDVSSGNIKCVLVDTGTYTYSAAHEFLSSVTGITATSGNMTTKTFTNGIFDADDFTFTAVTGAESEALIYYIDTGVAGTSRLITYKDTGLTGMPVTPNGGDINVTVDTGANKICAL